MLDALARSIAETAADVLGSRTTRQRAKVSDEEIGLYLWHERDFRDHDALVALINQTRIALDRPTPGGTVSCQPQSQPRPAMGHARPVQLSLDLMTA